MTEQSSKYTAAKRRHAEMEDYIRYGKFGRYADVVKKYESIESVDTPFYSHIRRLKAGSEYLPAFIMSKPILSTVSEKEAEHYYLEIGKILGVPNIQAAVTKSMNGKKLSAEKNCRRMGA